MAWRDEWRYRDCPWCGVRDAAMHHLGPLASPRSSFPARHWDVISCPRCGGLVLIEHHGPNVPQSNPDRVLPESSQAVDVDHLPDDVRAYYGDARRVLDAGVPDAAAVQLRKTLEAAAAHFGVDSGPLVQRIKKLIEQGLVTKTFGDVLHHVRVVGNTGAHASDVRVEEEAALRVMNFTTQVLRNLFEIPAELAAAVGAEAPEESSE